MPSRSNEEELKNLLAGHTVVSGVYDASKSPFGKGGFRGNMDVNGCEASLDKFGMTYSTNKQASQTPYFSVFTFPFSLYDFTTLLVCASAQHNSIRKTPQATGSR